MQWLAKVCVDRPVFTWVLAASAMVLGLASLGSLPVDRFPNIDIPMVTVVTPYPGASPGQVETEVSDPIEEAVNSVAGLDELRSTSYEGLSVVAVQFDLDVDADVAAQEIRDKIDRILGDLPDGLDPPRVEKIDPDAVPLYYVALEGPGTARELTDFAEDEVKARLEGLLGVGSVQVLGGREREIRVEVDPGRLRAHDLSVGDLSAALRRENLEQPGGDLTEARSTLQLRVPGRLHDVAAFEALPVRSRDGHLVRVGEVARVVDTAEDVESLAVLDGDPVVLLTITRQSGTNAIAVADGLTAEIEAIREDLPAGYAIEVVRDETTFVRTAVHAVQEHLILGALFAVLVVLLFLRSGRSTVISALAIPISIIATFAVLGALDQTLNVITLLALTLAVGIVIDDAIVVLENAIRFLQERDPDPRTATLAATKDVGLAVLATTLSLCAVFVPVVFMEGIVGRFLGSFGLTMTVAVMVSLVVAFSLTPMLCARWLKRDPKHAHHRPEPPAEPAPRLGRQAEKARYRQWLRGEAVPMQDGLLERVYGRVLAWCMAHRWAIGVAIAVSFASLKVVMPHVPTSFLPEDDEGRFEILLEAPQGTSLAATELASERLARAVRALPEVEHTVLLVGSEEGDVSGRGDNESLLYVGLRDAGERERSQTEVMQEIREELKPAFADQLTITVSAISAMGGSGAQAAPIQYVIRGPELARLEEYAEHLVGVLDAMPEIASADHTLRPGTPELRLEVDRARAAELGVSVAAVAETLGTLVGGRDVTDLQLGTEQYDVRVQATEVARARGELERFTVRASSGRLVPLAQVTRLREGVGPTAIERMSRQRSVTVYATTLPGASTATILQRLEEATVELAMPADYSTDLAGRAKEFGRTAKAFGVAILLSFIFMYLVIAAQFESWLHPVTILATLPMTVPFAMISLLIFGQSLNLFAMLGVLVLFGIVKKNAILQIDHMLHLMKEGWSRPDAIMLANRDRLRPILMTTLAFVAGMAPLMISTGAGSGTNHAIAGIVLGGQSLALGLTLLATPVLFTWLDDLQALTHRAFEKVRHRFVDVKEPAATDA